MQSCFAVQILARRPATLIENFVGFLVTCVSAVAVSKTRSLPLPSKYFTIHFYEQLFDTFCLTYEQPSNFKTNLALLQCQPSAESEIKPQLRTEGVGRLTPRSAKIDGYTAKAK